jgi:oligosaccharide repeat unit polymerase
MAFAVPTIVLLLALGVNAAKWKWLGLVSPSSMVLAGFLVFFSAAPLLTADNPFGEPIYSTPERFVPLVRLLLVGVICFLLGSSAAQDPRLRTRRGEVFDIRLDDDRFWRWYITIVSVTCLLTLLTASLMRVSPTVLFSRGIYQGLGEADDTDSRSMLLYSIMRVLFHVLAVLSAILIVKSKRRGRRWFGVSVVCLSLLFVLAIRNRYLFAYSAMGAVFVWFGLQVARRRGLGTKWLDRRLLPLLMAAGVLTVVTIQMIGLRSAYGLDDYLRNARWIDTRYFILSGLEQYPFLEGVLIAVPKDRPFVGGASFLSAFVLFVPRQIWPSKPTTAWAYMQEFLPEGFSNPNISYTILGELFLNFGLLGVVIGMLLTGFLCRKWFNLYYAHRHDCSLTILYYMSLPAFVILVRGDFQAACGNMIYPMIVVFVVLRGSDRKVVSRRK